MKQYTRNNLRSLLENKGMTQSDLAKRTGIRLPVINALVNRAEIQDVHVGNSAKIAAVLGLQSWKDLYSDSAQTDDQNARTVGGNALQHARANF